MNKRIQESEEKTSISSEIKVSLFSNINKNKNQEKAETSASLSDREEKDGMFIGMISRMSLLETDYHTDKETIEQPSQTEWDCLEQRIITSWREKNQEQKIIERFIQNYILFYLQIFFSVLKQIMVMLTISAVVFAGFQIIQIFKSTFSNFVSYQKSKDSLTTKIPPYKGLFVEVKENVKHESDSSKN